MLKTQAALCTPIDDHLPILGSKVIGRYIEAFMPRDGSRCNECMLVYVFDDGNILKMHSSCTVGKTNKVKDYILRNNKSASFWIPVEEVKNNKCIARLCHFKKWL